MVNIYFASPLFSQSEQLFNASVVQKIRQSFMNSVNVYLPQENEAINDKNAYADSLAIVDGDVSELDKSDVMIAVLDGQTMDAGVAAEIGYAYAKGIPVIGLYTDSRQQGAENARKIEALKNIGENQFFYINLFVVGMIKKNGVLVNSVDDVIDELKHRF